MALCTISVIPIARVGVTRVIRPNELKQLDEDLAAGRLSPAEYLRRRDELGDERGHDDDQTGRPPSSSDTRDDTPDTMDTESDTTDTKSNAADVAAPVASPFPPAFNWEGSPPNETTQVIYPVRDDADEESQSDTTQVVRRSDGQDSERTQVVQTSAAPYQPPPLSEGPMRQEQPSYQQDPNHGWDSFESAPPWAGTDLPPISDPQSGWMRQGPEFFEPAAERSNRKQIIGLSVVAVLVLALLGAGVAYFLSQGTETGAGSGEQTTQPNQPPPTSAVELPDPPSQRPPPVDTPQALIEPPGQPRIGGGLLDLPELEGRELVSKPVVSALRAGGMTDGVLKTTTQGQSTIGMFAFALPDKQAATTVAQTIAQVQLDGGFQLDNDRALKGVAVLGTPQGISSTVYYRAVYVLYDRAIFFEVSGPNRDAVLSTFDSLLDKQLAHAPPTVR